MVGDWGTEKAQQISHGDPKISHVIIIVGYMVFINLFDSFLGWYRMDSLPSTNKILFCEETLKFYGNTYPLVPSEISEKIHQCRNEDSSFLVNEIVSSIYCLCKYFKYERHCILKFMVLTYKLLLRLEIIYWQKLALHV